jgi:hypothetical protein
MDELGNRTGGIDVVHAVKKAVTLVFGLNALGAAAAISTIDAWLKNRPIQTID